MSEPTPDKRTVTTDALETLGMLLTKLGRQHRDAIHLAVEPATAGAALRPGEHVGLDTNGLAYRARGGNYPIKALGIVDPFITVMLETGDKFWLVVYPRQIKSLRHVWEHPDFPASVPATDLALEPTTTPDMTEPVPPDDEDDGSCLQCYS